MFKYDSTLGLYTGSIKVLDDTAIEINGKNIKVTSNRQYRCSFCNYKPVSCTDVLASQMFMYITVLVYNVNLQGGSKKVVVSAPSADAPMFWVLMRQTEHGYRM